MERSTSETRVAAFTEDVRLIEERIHALEAALRVLERNLAPDLGPNAQSLADLNREILSQLEVLRNQPVADGMRPFAENLRNRLVAAENAYRQILQEGMAVRYPEFEIEAVY